RSPSGAPLRLSPTSTSPDRNGPEQVLGMVRNDCSGSIGIGARNQTGINARNGPVRAQTAIDTYSKVAFAKLYDRKTPLTAADLMNDRVVPFFDEHEIAVSRVLTDRGTEFCGKPEHHEYELYLAIENIDHTRTKARSPTDERHLRAFPQDAAR